VTYVLACNGFIWNGDPEIDFSLPIDSALAYAALVRRGTAQQRFIKRKKGSSFNPAAAAAGGVAVSGGGDSADPSLSSLPFLGAELLEMPLPQIMKRVELYKACDWKGIEELECSESYDMAAALNKTENDEENHEEKEEKGKGDDKKGSVASSSFVGNSNTSLPSSAPLKNEVDSIPHLRPDFLPHALCTASTPYMRRDIVIWGDCVKLRYGLSPSDSPWLWNHMAIYIKRMARIFQALRIDNAHGTPLHVAAAMIDAARQVRPSLYVNAELFTGSVARDVEYASRLGITSLVREAMQSNSASELAGSLFGYGGAPVASLRPSIRGGSVAVRGV
jgi:hypothetical protein